MIREFRLPDLGEGLTESEIVSWHVTVGDKVTLNQVIAEVETAKAVVELPSPYEGIVSVLHEAAGTVVEVGSPIVSFDVGGAPGPAAPAPSGSQRLTPLWLPIRSKLSREKGGTHYEKNTGAFAGASDVPEPGSLRRKRRRP